MRATIAVSVMWAACLAAVAHAHVIQPPPTIPGHAPTTPDDVLTRFARLDTEGGQLTAEGWQGIAPLFTSAGERRSHTRLSVVSNYHVVKAGMTGERVAEGRVNYTHLGFLDISTGVFSSEHAGLHLRSDLRLVRVDSPPSPAGWKIQGAVPDPQITLATAIRQVTALLEKTTDRVVARNLRAARAALERLR